MKAFLSIVAISFLVIVDIVAGRSAESVDPLTVIIEAWLGIPDETDDAAPVDYAPGPGKPRPAEPGETAALAIRAQIPVGASTANVTGVFGPVVTWPIIPIHAVLLPDGRVMNYGTDASGAQGAQLIYDIWNPKLGTGLLQERFNRRSRRNGLLGIELGCRDLFQLALLRIMIEIAAQHNGAGFLELQK